MREPGNIDQVVSLQPDYLGLIFFENSPRYVQEEIQDLGSPVKKTGVFVNASEAFIRAKVVQYRLSAVQLHGDESPDFCRHLKQQLSNTAGKQQIIKVFSVKEEFDFDRLKAYEPVVDFFLFDTKGKERGGTGVRFNWEALKEYPSAIPFFLSGGIGPGQVQEIKELYRYFKETKRSHLFYGIDVNSRFEISPGIKDTARLRIFRKELFS